MSEELTEQPRAPRATFETLTARDVADPAAAVEVALSDGTSVLVRGMSRFEIHLGGRGTDDAAVVEARNLSYAVVDPPLTYEQARAWMKRADAGGDIARVSRTIRDLSGLGPGADKSNV
jgi:hypothetical protein